MEERCVSFSFYLSLLFFFLFLFDNLSCLQFSPSTITNYLVSRPVSGLETRGVDAKLEAQKQHFSRLLGTFSTDKDLFKKVYRSVFVFGKERDQRALNLDTAVTYWSLLFSTPGRRWISSTGEDLLAEWKAFLAENWTRSVNRDMWNMTLEFAYKTMEDGTLGFWSEDGAWPGVIDDFVAWYKASKDKDKATAVMDIDA